MNRMCAIFLCCLIAVSAAAKNSKTERPAKWAQPMKLTGAPNLHKVDDNLYRSAQPSRDGMKNLKKMGIETIVNLRSFNSDRKEIGQTGLAYEHIYMKAWHPERKEIVRFLQIVTNPKRTPVLVHCQHGADRTGTMCAIYRVAVQGWSKKDAIEEMTKGDMGFHEIWKNLPKWIEDLDIEQVKKDAGMKNKGVQMKESGALSFSAKSIDGKEIKLDKYKGKVVLMVNVASRCGQTKQYAQLQKLHEEYQKDGLTILGFPCNQFREQEPGSEEQIKSFCTKNYGVTFQLFSKIEVNGENAHPLYKYLTSDQVKTKDTGVIRWNFEKFLIDRSGTVIDRFHPRIQSDDPKVIKAIKQALKTK